MRAAAFVMLLASCRGTDSKREPTWLDETKLIEDDFDDPEADAIVILRDLRLRFQATGVDGDSSQIQVHEATKILSEAAFDRASVRLFWPKNSTLLHLEGRTIAPDGTVTPVDSAQLLATEAKVDTGEKKETIEARFFQFPRVEVGSILELSYTVQLKGIYGGWSEQMTDSVPVRDYRVEIVVDNVAVPQMLVLNHAAKATTTVGEDGFKHVRLEAKNLPPEIDDDLAPSSKAIEPWWIYRTLRIEFPNNIWYINQDWADATRPLKNLIVKGKGIEGAPALDVASCNGAVACVIDRAVTKTRELTVFTGFEDALDARKLPEILADGTASSADKTLLLYALLKKAGLDANMVVCARAGTLKIRTDFPSSRWLNHSLVMVRDGNAAYWIDPSCELCTPGTLPSWDPIGEDVLVLSPERGEISASWWTLNAQPAPHENVHTRTLTIELQKDGDANITVDERHEGERALFENARSRNDDDDDARRAALSVAGSLSRGSNMVAHVPTECDRQKGVCTRVVKVFVPHFAHVGDDGLRVPLDRLRGLYDLEPDERKSDVQVTRALVDVDEVRIIPPAGMRVENAPQPAKASGGLIDAATEIKQDGKALVVKRAVRVKAGRVAKKDIGPMQAALDAASSLEAFVVHIKNDQVASGSQ